MRRFVTAFLVTCGVLAGAREVQALPVLQLDVVGGYYDSATETIFSNGPTFTLVALLTPKAGVSFSPSDVYFISAAIVPQTGPVDVTLGSYLWNGTRYDVTEDMEYGVPPLEELHAAEDQADSDPGDLAKHDIYPTFFNEFAFSFSAAQQTARYNTQDTPGRDPVANAGTGSYYQTFTVTLDRALVSGGYGLHFDLYDTYLRNCLKSKSCGTADEDIDHFAPFSHDAQSGPGQPPPVPEPATILLLGTGLALSVRRLRR